MSEPDPVMVAKARAWCSANEAEILPVVGLLERLPKLLAAFAAQERDGVEKTAFRVGHAAGYSAGCTGAEYPEPNGAYAVWRRVRGR